MRTLRFGHLAAEPEIHAGCRKEQRSEWRVPGAVKNVARYDQQILSQLPAVKAPVQRDDNREEDNERERVEKHYGRAICLFKRHFDCQYNLPDLTGNDSDLRDSRERS